MNPQLFQRVKTVFLQACEQPEHERTEFLDRACNGDRELRFAVEDLLMNDEQPLNLMQSNHMRSRLGELAAIFASDDAHAESIALPPSIGRYRTLKKLGEGGMGVVYLAEQDSPRRTVALKIIASGRSSRQVLRRFEHEAQILGRLQHPGIAQIFEAGTFETSLGLQPYFAMELVEGPSLLEFVRERDLSVSACIDLFIKVCDGVEHAHQKGVIHRDLKPGNILVHSQSQVEQPKILDFGVARMTDFDVQATTMHTGSGQLVGTVAYMSPEQVTGDVSVLDTRSDVYALGVILYQLVTGQFPYRVEGSMRDVLDAILTAEPIRPGSINRRVDDEVETILLKCLSKELPRRYQSAGELAQDLQRYQAGEPIQAKRNSTVYVLRKAIRRHRTAALVAASFLLVVAAGLVVSLSAWRSAVKALDEKEVQRGIAAGEASKAQTVNQFLNEMLSSANPQLAPGRDISVSETLDDAARLLDAGHLRDQLEVEAAVRMTIGEAYLALANYAQAEHHLQAALDIREQLLGHVHADTARSLDRLGELRRKQGDLAASEKLRTEAVSIFRAVNMGDHEDFAAVLMNQAMAVWHNGNMQNAVVIAQESVDMEQRLHGETHPSVAHAKAKLAIILHQPAECVALLERALQTERQTRGPKHPQVPRTLIQLGTIQQFSGNLDAAEQHLLEAITLNREIFGSDHPESLSTITNLNMIYIQRGQFDRMLALLRENQPIAAKAYGEKSLGYAQYVSGMADPLFRTGDVDGSEAASREALSILREIGSDQSAPGATTRIALAVNCIERNNLAEAETLLGEILSMKETELPSEHWTRPQATSQLGEILLARKLFAEAQEKLTQGYDGLVKCRTPAENRFYAARRLAALYEAWNAVEPDTGKQELAAHWRSIRDAERPASLDQ